MQEIHIIGMLFGVCISHEARLLDALANNNCAQVEHILSQGPTGLVNKQLHQNGDTALHIAATQSTIEMTQLLLKYNADTGTRARAIGATPLHIAAACGSLSIVQVLVEAGAGVNDEDQHQRTALHYAVDSDEISVVRYLLSQGARCIPDILKGHTPLHEAVAKEHTEMIDLLLMHESSLIATSDMYRTRSTLLHIAAAIGRKDLLEKLRAHGHVLDTQDGKGYTPLHTAVCKSHIRCVQYLAAEGADLDIAETWQGRAPLHTAAHKSNMRMVSLLVQHGADVMTKDSLGYTPLLHAISKSSIFPNFMHPFVYRCNIEDPYQKRAIVTFLLFYDTYEDLTQNSDGNNSTILDYLSESCYRDLFPLCLHMRKGIDGILALPNLRLPVVIQKLIREFIMCEVRYDLPKKEQHAEPQRLHNVIVPHTPATPF